jgi:hypothetical protein
MSKEEVDAFLAEVNNNLQLSNRLRISNQDPLWNQRLEQKYKTRILVRNRLSLVIMECKFLYV